MGNTHIRKLLIGVTTALALAGFQQMEAQEGNRLSLAGVWLLTTDSVGHSYSINLPGSTDEAGIGKEHINGTPLYIDRPETWQLARRRVFIGEARYRKELNIPSSWKGKRVELSLERCMWQTSLWINGCHVGNENSLCTPHIYDITDYIVPGSGNAVELRIDNSPYVNLGSWSHGYSPGIQTVWNGAIGELFVEAKDEISVDGIQCYPSLKDKSVRVTGVLNNLTAKDKKGSLHFRLLDAEGRTVLRHKERIVANENTTNFEVTLRSDKTVKAWDEYLPYLYTLKVESRFGSYSDTEEVRIGFRDMEVKGGQIVLNGRTLFLRGEHDPGSFPLTGYPSMNKDEWVRIFRIGKEYGLNHWRFHSWCPPEAAFAAADEEGIYLQPELTLFSQNWEKTRVGEDSLRDEFLKSELQLLLDTYGNHPSFIFMCMGNELKGSESVLEQWVEYGKKHDSRHLYASNANLEAMGKFLPLKGDEFQVAHAARVNNRRYERRMGSYFNSERPNTVNDYSHTMKSPYDKMPVITHELGQWEVYPDFGEIDKYTGVLAPRNMEIFRSILQQKGMADMAPRFLEASGKLAALLYREEIERVLRTPGLDGFQMLDLRDYQAQGSALVGILNAFWDSKGLITPEEFRQSCNDVTLLLKMPKRTWLSNEDFTSELVIPNYGKGDLKNTIVHWKVVKNGKELLSDSIRADLLPQGQVASCGTICFPLKQFTEKATQFEIILNAPSLGIENKYKVWAYPEKLPDEPKNITISREATPELLQSIEEGATVLLVPKSKYDGERMTFATPFWSTLMFDYQPKTMGIVCNPEHPVFTDFPTDFHSDWQWWELTNNTYVARINDTPSDYRPLLQVIDHPVRNDKLGAIMETRIGKGRLLICTLDILSSPDKRTVARQLKHSILNYMSSPAFNPQEVPGLKEQFFLNLKKENPYKSIVMDQENQEHPVSNMFDNRLNTHCELPLSAEKATITIELKSERYITGCSLPKDAEGVTEFKVYVTNDKSQKGNVIIKGNGKKDTYQAIQWDNGFTVQRGKKGCFVIIEIDKTVAKPATFTDFGFLFGD